MRGFQCSIDSEPAGFLLCVKNDELWVQWRTRVVSEFQSRLVWTLQVEDVRAEAHRLSRCLSQASFPPADMREEHSKMEVTDTENYCNLACLCFICFIVYSETLILIQPPSSSFKNVEGFSTGEVVYMFIIWWWLKWELGGESLPRVQESESLRSDGRKDRSGPRSW